MTNYDATNVRRGQIPSAEMMMDLQDAVEQASRAGGYGMVQYPGGNQFLPPDIEEIWAIVVGQGSGSGNAATDNRYEWTEGMVSIATNGDESIIVNPSGLTGTQVLNPLIEVRGSTDVPDGYITRAYRSPSGNAWLFTYDGEDAGSGSGAGGGSVTTHCSDGTTHRVRIIGNDIYVEA